VTVISRDLNMQLLLSSAPIFPPDGVDAFTRFR